MAKIVAASADAIVSSDLSGGIVSWNQAAETIFGYTAEEMIGKTSFVITPPERLEEARMIKEHARRGERVDHLETFRVARSGELIEVAMSVFPLRDAAGVVSGTSAVMRDIREQKKAERRLRQISGRLLTVQDEERRRLALELHDSTAQSLAALSINLSLLHQDDGSAPPAKRATWVADSLALAEGIARELRTHAYLLHPPLLDERGLPAALRWFVEGFAARSGIDVELAIAPEIARLPEPVEMTIFRVVQESLSNVHRHAKSATARIRLARAGGWITVEICDDGCGMARDLSESVGVGIAGMRERLAHLGGVLTMESSPSGTAVKARIPDQ
jgi:PAS domain S-box-containing protein